MLVGVSDEVWEEGPPREAYWLLRSCGNDMMLETTATRMELAQSMWAEFKKRGTLQGLFQHIASGGGGANR